MHIGVLLAYMSVEDVHAWGSWRPEEHVRSSGTGVTDGFESDLAP